MSKSVAIPIPIAEEDQASAFLNQPTAESSSKRRLMATAIRDGARGIFIQKVSSEMERIIIAQVESAKGIWVEKEVTDPVDHSRKIVKIYQKPPSVEAGQYLLNQVIGKPVETIEQQDTITLVIDK